MRDSIVPMETDESPGTMHTASSGVGVCVSAHTAVANPPHAVHAAHIVNVGVGAAARVFPREPLSGTAAGMPVKDCAIRSPSAPLCGPLAAPAGLGESATVEGCRWDPSTLSDGLAISAASGAVALRSPAPDAFGTAAAAAASAFRRPLVSSNSVSAPVSASVSVPVLIPATAVAGNFSEGPAGMQDVILEGERGQLMESMALGPGSLRVRIADRPSEVVAAQPPALAASGYRATLATAPSG